jgi:hypothetical protein
VAALVAGFCDVLSLHLCIVYYDDDDGDDGDDGDDSK